MEPSCVEAQDNQGIGGREPVWALGWQMSSETVAGRRQGIWLWQSLSSSGGGGDI